MVETLSALAPVFLLIVLGWSVRAGRLLTEEALGAMNRFGYFVLYPAFLFSAITGADLADAGAARFIAAVLLGFGAMSILALGAVLLIRHGPTFTSVFQGALRWNGFSILAAAEAVFGREGQAFIAMAFGPSVLFINVVCVAVLARWGENGSATPKLMAAQIAGNPLILACVAGLAAKGLGVTSFGPLSHALELLAPAALPIALIAVGAGLDLRAALRARGWVALAAGSKLLLAPAVFWLSSRALGLDPLHTAVAVGLASTPTAAASYVLSREMGGDARLMAAIVSATTLLSFLTMPIVIAAAML